MFRRIIDLIYPDVCASCGNPISRSDDTVCPLCFSHMSFCPYRPGQTHPIEKIFWGRSEVHCAVGLFIFSKHGTVQKLLHRLKYKGDRDVGLYLGKMLGRRIQLDEKFRTASAIVPVPMFHKKQQQRGYNQASVIGEGLAEVIGTPVVTEYLQRVENSSSQTRKGRLERVENVSSAFALSPGEHSQHEHILLIDDVITTGSTLEACINILSPLHRVSVATLAYQ